MKNSLKIFVPLFIVLVVDTMGFGLVFPIIGPLLFDPHSGMLPVNASLTERSFFYGLTNISVFLALLFGAPYFGDLSDKFGRKKIIITCLAVIAFGYVISAIGLVYKSLWLFILGRTIDGFAAGCESIAQAAIIDISPPERKTINLSLISVAGCLGFVIGPLVGGVFSDKSISQWFGYTTPFIIAAALAVLNAICLVFTFTETHVVKNVKLDLLRGLTMFKSAFTEKRIRHLSVIFLLIQVAWAIYFQVVSLVFAETYHYLPKQIGMYYAYIGVLIALTMLFLIRVFLKFMKERVLIVVSCVMAVFGVLLNIVMPTSWMPWVSVIFIGLGTSMAYACMLSLYSSSVSEEHQGWVMGVANAVIAVSWAIGGMVISAVDVSHVLITFMVTAGLLVGAVVLSPWMRRRADLR